MRSERDASAISDTLLEVAGSWRPLGHAEIEAWLVLYPPDERCLTQLSYRYGRLRGRIRPQTPSYTHVHVPYLTASQLTLVASQSGYLLAGAVIRDPDFGMVPSRYYNLFLRRLRSVELYYTKLRFKFRRRLSNASDQSFTLVLSKLRTHRHTLFAEFSLDCGDGGAVASMTLGMPLD